MTFDDLLVKDLRTQGKPIRGLNLTLSETIHIRPGEPRTIIENCHIRFCNECCIWIHSEDGPVSYEIHGNVVTSALPL